MKVVVVGLSGSGKTSLGKSFSESGLGCVDLDRLVEESAGCSIAEVIRVEGESRFRDLESEALERALTLGVECVVTGGGVVGRNSNRSKLLSCDTTIVWLNASDEVLLARIRAEEDVLEQEAGGRPLLVADALHPEGKSLSVSSKLAAMRAEREPLYREVSTVQVRTDWAPISGVRSVIESSVKNSLESGTTVFPTPIRCGLQSDEAQCQEVIVASLTKLEQVVASIFPKARVAAVVYDSNLDREYVETAFFSDPVFPGSVCSGPGESPLQYKFIAVGDGESVKQFSKLESLCEQFVELGLTRSDIVVAVGGGAVGDLVGFAASVYLRGVGLVQVPTTMLSMADASVGGKTSVNLVGGKNLAGSFYPARLVWMSPEWLKSMPQRDYVSGLAEVVKYGLIHSKNFFEWIEQQAESIVSRSDAAVRTVVEESVAAKLRFVANDLYEQKEERIQLNFGHTIGHVVERLGGYRDMLHGEAVSIGMVAALQLGVRVGVTSPEIVERARRLLQALGLPTEVTESHRNAGRVQWKALLRADKKRANENIRFVLVEALGKARTEDVSVETVLEVIFKD